MTSSDIFTFVQIGWFVLIPIPILVYFRRFYSSSAYVALCVVASFVFEGGMYLLEYLGHVSDIVKLEAVAGLESFRVCGLFAMLWSLFIQDDRNAKTKKRIVLKVPFLGALVGLAIARLPYPYTLIEVMVVMALAIGVVAAIRLKELHHLRNPLILLAIVKTVSGMLIVLKNNIAVVSGLLNMVSVLVFARLLDIMLKSCSLDEDKPIESF